MRIFTTVAVLGILAIPLVSTCFGADEFKIKFDRPYHAGDSVMISTKVDMKMSQKAEIGGAVQEQKTNFKAILEGTETIDAVTGKANDAYKITIKVAKCTKDGAELVPAGAAITAENADGKTLFKVDGAEPADDINQVLAELIDTSKPDDPSADDLIGTDKPQKVGDTWPARTDMIAKQISDGPIQLTGDQLKAESKLTDVSTVEGRPTETVKSIVTADVPRRIPTTAPMFTT